MRLAWRAAVSVALGMAVVVAGVIYTNIPVPKDCGSGGFGFSNSGGRNVSAPPNYGGTFGLSFAPEDSITFSWTAGENGTATLVVLDSAGQSIYNQTGSSGSGSFSVGPAPHNETYTFALPLPPPREYVSLNYQCRSGT